MHKSEFDKGKNPLPGNTKQQRPGDWGFEDFETIGWNRFYPGKNRKAGMTSWNAYQKRHPEKEAWQFKFLDKKEAFEIDGKTSMVSGVRAWRDVDLTQRELDKKILKRRSLKRKDRGETPEPTRQNAITNVSRVVNRTGTKH